MNDTDRTDTELPAPPPEPPHAPIAPPDRNSWEFARQLALAAETHHAGVPKIDDSEPAGNVDDDGAEHFLVVVSDGLGNTLAERCGTDQEPWPCTAWRELTAAPVSPMDTDQVERIARELDMEPDAVRAVLDAAGGEYR